MSLFSRIGAFSIPVSALLLFFATVHAGSCEPGDFTLADAYEEADSIIVGVVTACERVDSAGRSPDGGDRCAFSTLEVLKDANPARDYAGFAESAGCGLRLQVGQQYLLFLNGGNEPLRYSEPIGTGDWIAIQVNARIAILRDFRNGVTADISEPWFFYKSFFDTCMLLHRVRGNQLDFTRRPESARRLEEFDWSRVMIEGRSVAFTPEQVRMFKSMVEYGRDMFEGNPQTLAVGFVESPPWIQRSAAISVGSRSWSLEPRRLNIHRKDEVVPAGFKYIAQGQAAEEILAALETPSDVVVTAIASTGNGATPDAVVAQGPTEESSMSLRSPEPVLRFETRSTNLQRAIAEYRSCYRGESR